ncbi:MAG: InlB B-repeat-containing protein, partial [Clostridiales bacterium]|nr:InlB B-repeat-containing protein [Clostridiales bacterium]
MSSLRQKAKKTLSVILCLLMLSSSFSMIVASSAPAAGQNSFVRKAANVKPGEVYFNVPEVIYLKPSASSSSGTFTFQYALDQGMIKSKETNEIVQFVNRDYKTFGKDEVNIDFYCDTADPKAGVAISCSNVSVSLGQNMMSVKSGEISHTSITSGYSSSYSSQFVYWTATYTDISDGLVKTAGACTYIYAPFVHSVASSAGNYDYNYKLFAGNQTWSMASTATIYGIHEVKTPATSNEDPSIIYNGTDSAGTTSHGNATVRYTGEYMPGSYPIISDYTCPTWYGEFSAPSFYKDNATNYMRYTYRDADYAGGFNAASPIGLVYIDSSRSEKFSQVPFLTLRSDCNGYKQYSGKSNNLTAYSYATAFANNSFSTVTGSNIYSSGEVNRADSSGSTSPRGNYSTKIDLSQIKTDKVKSLVVACITHGHVQDSGEDDFSAQAWAACDVMSVDKSALRLAVENAQKYMGVLGVTSFGSNANLVSAYFDGETVCKWNSFVEKYKAATMVLTKVDGFVSASYDTQGEINNLAKALNEALIALRTKVTLDANGGSLNGTAESSIAVGSLSNDKYIINTSFDYTPSQTPAPRDGYTFMGWSTNKNANPKNSAEYSNTVKVGFNDIVYAVWKPGIYRLQFLKREGGKAFEGFDNLVECGSVITAPQNPKADSFIFDGWDKQVPATMPAYNLTVTAKWKEENNAVYYGSLDISADNKSNYLEGGDYDHLHPVYYSPPVNTSAKDSEYVLEPFNPSVAQAVIFTVTLSENGRVYVALGCENGETTAVITGTKTNSIGKPLQTSFDIDGTTQDFFDITDFFTVGEEQSVLIRQAGVPGETAGPGRLIVGDIKLTTGTNSGNVPVINQVDDEGLDTLTDISSFNKDSKYKATFIADGSVVGIVEFDYNSTSITEPRVPQKTGYTGAWENYTIGVKDIEINAVYTPITYIAKFFAGSNLIDTREYTVESESINEPKVPEKTGYRGVWEPYSFTPGGISIQAVYVPITYTATFIADGSIVKTVEYTIETETIQEPAVPVKVGYTARWADYKLVSGGIEINAVYTPVIYEAKFYCDGALVDSIKYTVEDTSLTEPAPLAKTGYTVAWPEYEIKAGGITVNAVYTPIRYMATFLMSGNAVIQVEYTVEDEFIEEPAVPFKDGYIGKWENYTLKAGGITVNPVYTPEEYKAVFVVDGTVIAEVPYTVETERIIAPVVPYKQGYAGNWEKYTLLKGGITVNAFYTPAEFIAVFVADGNIVYNVGYNSDSTSIEEPEVPSKRGYTGRWEDYVLRQGGITVDAVYTPINYEAVFVADGETVGTVEYTVVSSGIEEPAVPVKTGYTGEWGKYLLVPGGI